MKRITKMDLLRSCLLYTSEHDVLASAILLTPCEELAQKTIKELEIQCKALSRADIIGKSLQDYGAVIVCRDMDEAVEFANELAPEPVSYTHLTAVCQ